MGSQTTSHSNNANSWKGAVCERRVEVEFAKYGYSTFIPAWGQQPVQDLVAIRGDDVRLIQVKKARRKIDKRGPMVSVRTALWQPFSGTLVVVERQL